MSPFAHLTLSSALVLAVAAPAAAKPAESRLHPQEIEASSVLLNERNLFVENHHQYYVSDDDPATAWIEGAKTSGAGEWLRFTMSSSDAVTRTRLRIRNGCQASKEAWAAHARAKAVTVRILPAKVERQVTLADKSGWQDIIVDAAGESLESIELAVGSAYEGAKSQDLCISDIQVLATSDEPSSPSYEKYKRERLARWRATRIAAAKAFAAKAEQPLYPSYAIQWTPDDDQGEVLEEAAADPVFAKEWKGALEVATALYKDLDKMTRVQITPARADKLVAVDGFSTTRLKHVLHGYSEEPASLRLPILGIGAAMFTNQLRVVDVKDKLTTEEFKGATGPCKANVGWVWRTPSPEATGPARLTAIAIGFCERVEQRDGWHNERGIELMVYDAAGRLVLVAGDGYISGYRWTIEGGKSMLVGGRAIGYGGIAESKRRETVAVK